MSTRRASNGENFRPIRRQSTAAPATARFPDAAHAISGNHVSERVERERERRERRKIENVRRKKVLFFVLPVKPVTSDPRPFTLDGSDLKY